MFKVELAAESSQVLKGKSHPIYDLKYVLHRKVTIEEPYKRAGPVQCTNCQEFGHTRTYCKLTQVCVGCGGNHLIAACPNDRKNATLKKCSNCGGNHTANYRGCIVYREVAKKAKPIKHPQMPKLPAQPEPNYVNPNPIIPIQPPRQYHSYANAVKQQPDN